MNKKIKTPISSSNICEMIEGHWRSLKLYEHVQNDWKTLGLFEETTPVPNSTRSSSSPHNCHLLALRGPRWRYLAAYPPRPQKSSWFQSFLFSWFRRFTKSFNVSRGYLVHITKFSFHVFWKILISYPRFSRFY